MFASFTSSPEADGAFPVWENLRLMAVDDEDEADVDDDLDEDDEDLDEEGDLDEEQVVDQDD